MKKKTAWGIHLMAFKHKHPKKSLEECMKLASKTYKKKGK